MRSSNPTSRPGAASRTRAWPAGTSSPAPVAKRLDKLQRQDVQIWLNKIRQIRQCCAQGKDAQRLEAKRRCCAVGRCCGQVASPATVVHLRRVLRIILSQAVTDALIPGTVASNVKLPTARKRRGRAWSSEEARRFLESARRDNDPLSAAYVLASCSDSVRGEVLGLAWEDVDFEAGELAVAWQLQRLGGRLVRRETKTDSSDSALQCRTSA